ncbi:hypothetical protein ABW20_dc0109286 [Dactylellina cionopaga]|nr:hypothetical protein ABW20_dc0109286 [Dactylellina cionopaga]
MESEDPDSGFSSSSDFEIQDFDSEKINNYIARIKRLICCRWKRGNSKFSWTTKSREQLYLLKLVYHATDEVIAMILSYLHKRICTIGAVAFQYAEYRRKPINVNIRQELKDQIALGDLSSYKKHLSEVRRAAMRFNIALQPCQSVIPPARSHLRLLTEKAPSTIARGVYNNCDDFPTRSSSQRSISPKLLYRVYNENSHGLNNGNGFYAGAFASLDSQTMIPILEESDIPELDWNLAAHLKGHHLATGSMFISTTQSLLWAFHKASNMEGNVHIAIIDREKISQPVVYLSEIYTRLKEQGRLQGIQRYRGRYEYLVHANIPEEAVITDFSIYQFKRYLRAIPSIEDLICPDITFRNWPRVKPVEKKESFKDESITQSRYRAAMVALLTWIFGNSNHAAKESFEGDVYIDWEVGSRLKDD